jgi:PhoPQ-activated pathogenicity-related protein
MKKTRSALLFFFLLTTALSAFAQTRCDNASLAQHPQAVLSCYLAEPETIAEPWVLEGQKYDADQKLYIETYTLSSQVWPKPNLSQKGLLWKHTLILYRPETVKTTQALLFIDGGTRYLPKNSPNHFNVIDFARIAKETSSIVIDLKDIPNQALGFDDGQLRVEDGIIAYTWNRFMDDPEQGHYWPAHLPMAKAVIKAMDAAQQIAEQNHLQIRHFVISGASKRGWTAWLVSLEDTRINALVPIVIDSLNTKKNLQHIYQVYNHTWPLAFHDHVEQNIPARMNTPAFDRLLAIEDPLSYLNCDHCDFYKQRLRIPKYLISSSGDDFFVPDSLNLYLPLLPGENQVRELPNQSHAVDMKIIESALLAYYRTIVHHETRPKLSWRTSPTAGLTEIITDQEPLAVTLWEAENPQARDFRLASKIIYMPKKLKGQCLRQDRCSYAVSIPAPLQGWKADFIEVSFNTAQGDPLVLTTPTYIKGK